MGVIVVTDDVQSLIERQVEIGRSETISAFVNEAVRRLVDDADLEEEEEAIAAATAGIADMEAGRFVTVTTSGDREALYAATMARLKEDLATAR